MKSSLLFFLAFITIQPVIHPDRTLAASATDAQSKNIDRIASPVSGEKQNQQIPKTYNVLADPGMDLEVDQKKKDGASPHIKQFREQSAGTRSDKTTGNIGGGNITTRQSSDYTGGKIGDTLIRQELHPADNRQSQGREHESPDDEGTGGLSSIRVDRRNIIISLWNNRDQDGDIINIYLNGQLISTGIFLKKAQKSIQVELNSGKNFLTVEALNEGNEPPNTAVIAISNVIAGKSTQLSRRNSGQKAVMNLYAP